MRWNITQDVTSLPSSLSSLSVAQGSHWTWAPSTTDVRALQSADPTTRRASTYFDPNEVRVVLNFKRSWYGTLRVYAVDWDTTARRESITVGGQTASLNSDFSQDAWVAFTGWYSGAVTIKVDRTARAERGSVRNLPGRLGRTPAGSPPAVLELHRLGGREHS